ncbi:hypothetical protein OAJ18_01685 [Pelagibacteraceae bacterium]|nr:hypothetical protein [Pelagibacteraceae bacterium]
MKLFKPNHLLVKFTAIVFTLIVSYFFSQAYLIEQYAVDGGLVLSNKITYPDDFAPLKDYFFGAWTSIHQIAALLFKFEWSVLDVSKFFIFFIALFYFIGVASIVLSFTKSIVIALLVSTAILIFQKNFGDTDYPTLFFSSHTFGALSLAISTCIFGLLFLGNFFIVGFLSIFLISIHPVVGLWTCLIVFSSIGCSKIIFKEDPDIRNTIRGTIGGLIISSVSFFFYQKNYFSASYIDLETLNNYYKYWEGHRSSNEYHIEYFSKTLLLFIFGIFGLSKIKNSINEHVRLGILSVLISIFFSSLIYLIFKIFHNFEGFPLWLIQIMPTRFTIMHSVVGWPLILGILFVILKEFSKNRKQINYLPQLTIIFLIILYTAQHYKVLLSTKNSYIRNINYQKVLSKNDDFWKVVKNRNIGGYVLTTPSSSSNTLRKGLKPILLNPGSIDGVPYFPKTAVRLSKIVEEIYGISFDDPPLELKNTASITEKFIKKNFEKYSKEKWKEISNKFNISAIIVPVDWNIILVPIAKNNTFAFYII